MSPATSPLLKTAFYLLLSTPLFAFPMMEEPHSTTHGETDSKKRTGEYRDENTVSGSTEVSNTSQSERRDNSGILNVAEKPVTESEIPVNSNELVEANQRIVAPTGLLIPPGLSGRTEENIRIAIEQVELIQLKAKKADKNGKDTLASNYRSVVAKQKEAVALHMQALEAEAAEKTDQGIHLNNAGISTKLSAEAELKAIEADENRKTELAERYRRITAKHEEAAVLAMQALEAEAIKNIYQASYLNDAGVSTKLSAEAELKAIEADENGKTELAERYRSVAAKHNEAVALYMKAVQAEATGETNQQRYLRAAGETTLLIAEAELKAIEADENGKNKLAECYRSVAAKQEEALVLAMQALQAEKAGKTKQGISRGKSGYVTRLSTEAELKAIEADENGEPRLAGIYRRVAKMFQESATLFYRHSIQPNKQLHSDAMTKKNMAQNLLNEIEGSL